MHEIKQAVNCRGPELLLRNAPPPPASASVHFLHKIRKYSNSGHYVGLFDNIFTKSGHGIRNKMIKISKDSFLLHYPLVHFDLSI